MAIWEEIIKDPDEVRVFESFADSKWDFRSLDGISRTTGLQAGDVLSILTRHHDLVRSSVIPDRKGRTLYTLRENPQTFGEKIGALKSYVTKSPSSTKIKFIKGD